jgi:hypothetical protein
MSVVPYSQSSARDVPFGLRELKEEIPALRALQYKRSKLWGTNQKSTNNYTFSEVIDVRLVNTWLIQIINRHATAGILVMIYGAVDPDDSDGWELLNTTGTAILVPAKSSAPLNVRGLGCTDAYGFVKVAVKSAVDNTPADYFGYFAGKGGNIQ